MDVIRLLHIPERSLAHSECSPNLSVYEYTALKMGLRANLRDGFRLFGGNMSPEYAMDGVFSMKSDVFSFGVLVLEMVTGRRNRGFYQPQLDLNLLRYVSANLNHQNCSLLNFYICAVDFPGMDVVERRQEHGFSGRGGGWQL